jgi:hypothetical protein
MHQSTEGLNKHRSLLLQLEGALQPKSDVTASQVMRLNSSTARGLPPMASIAEHAAGEDAGGLQSQRSCHPGRMVCQTHWRMNGAHTGMLHHAGATVPPAGAAAAPQACIGAAEQARSGSGARGEAMRGSMALFLQVCLS